MIKRIYVNYKEAISLKYLDIKLNI